MWSRTRPGVPTTTWAPSLRATIWGPRGRPPTIATARTPASRPAVSMSPATWRQSSRVGTTTRAWTSGSSGSTSWTIGMPKASVLPVPVRAWPMRSTPASASGRQSVWMGKGCSIPTRASEVNVVGVAPRSPKLGSVGGARVPDVGLKQPPGWNGSTVHGSESTAVASAIPGDLRVDLLAPGVDAAGQAADPGPAAGLQPHRRLGAAGPDVAVDDHVAVLGDLGRGPLHEPVEADVQGRLDHGHGPLGVGADVDQQRRVVAGQGRGQRRRVDLLEQGMALSHPPMLPPAVQFAAT